MQGESLRRTANSSARKVSGLRPVSAIAVATYEKAALEQGKYEARRLRNYVSKLGQYLSKSEGAAAFLLRHSGERVFYVAPWRSRLSGVTMTIARLARRVWAARKGLIEMPTLTAEQEELVALLLDPVVCASNAP